MPGFILDFLQVLTTIAMVVMRIVPIFYSGVDDRAFIVVVIIYFGTLVIDGKIGHGLSIGQAICLTFFAFDYMFSFVTKWSGGDLNVTTWVWIIIGLVSVVLNGIQMYQRWNNHD
ncbi:MAG: hypothetical protein WC784_04865 [Candidatus Shapirobacteria bacterium]|jgi:hypothetical protein